MLVKPFLMAWLKRRFSEVDLEYLTCNSQYVELGCKIYGDIISCDMWKQRVLTLNPDIKGT